MLTIFLMLLALVLFLLEACSVTTGRYKLGWFGAAAVTLAWVIPHFPAGAA